MSQQPFKTTSIVIGDTDNVISRHDDGSMLFKDPYVTVKLKDLVGGTVVINPAILVIVDASDWVYLPSEDLYAVEVTHNYAFVGNEKIGCQVETMNSSYEKIGIDTIISKENSVYLKITQAIDVYIAIKKL